MSSNKLTGHHHGRHAGREDLAGEYRLGDAIQLVLLFIFLAIWILDSFVLHYTTFLVESIPGYIRWISGIILLLAAGYLSRAGLRIIFGEIREEPHVVTKGVFSLVRHPIYLASILTYGHWPPPHSGCSSSCFTGIFPGAKKNCLSAGSGMNTATTSAGFRCFSP